jgi:hypothetical protein
MNLDVMNCRIDFDSSLASRMDRDDHPLRARNVHDRMLAVRDIFLKIKAFLLS